MVVNFMSLQAVEIKSELNHCDTNLIQIVTIHSIFFLHFNCLNFAWISVVYAYLLHLHTYYYFKYILCSNLTRFIKIIIFEE